MYKQCQLLALLLLALIPFLYCDQYSVNTTYGPVLGGLRTTTTTDSVVGTPYVSFQGLPFANPPIGKLRLRPPVPPTPWSAALDLSGSSSVACPQLTGAVSGDFLGQEDCLLLNIYSPSKAFHSQTDELAPVLVWIYGGGFLTGSARYDEYGPDRWLDEGLVVVTVNYRGGALGFLSLGTPEVPGNQGLLDQLMALEFVQANIALFGGDPARVTMMGQSAGSSSVLYHLMSPRSEGLFSQVIAESGSNFSPSLHSITASQAARYGVEAAVAMGCIFGDRLECLQNKSPEAFVRLNAAISVNLKPNEDGEYAEVPFMPISPMEALTSGQYYPVPALVGTNKEDGLILTTPLTTDPSLYVLYRNLWSVIAPGILFHVPVDESSFEMSQKANQLAEFYLGGTSNIRPENFYNITDMFTDAFVTYPMECFVEYARKTQPVFQYIYSHQGEYGLNPDAGLPKFGVNHGDELYLMWEPIYDANRDLNAADSEMSQQIIQLWTSFIKTGVPTSSSGVEWSAVTASEQEYLVLDNEPYMARTDDYAAKMDFWQQIFPC